MVGCEFQPLVRDLARKLTTCTSELPADAIEYWEPEGGDPNSVADIHEFLKITPDCSFDTVVCCLGLFSLLCHAPQQSDWQHECQLARRLNVTAVGVFPRGASHSREGQAVSGVSSSSQARRPPHHCDLTA